MCGSYLLILHNINKEKYGEIVIPLLYSEYEIEQVIFGSLLGDGALEKQDRYINARFRFI